MQKVFKGPDIDTFTVKSRAQLHAHTQLHWRLGNVVQLYAQEGQEVHFAEELVTGVTVWKVYVNLHKGQVQIKERGK